eukprot:1102369-Prymnesium_polylepis.1
MCQSCPLRRSIIHALLLTQSFARLTAAGRFNPDIGGTRLADCMPSPIVPAAGSNEATRCSPGTHQSTEGATRCDDCAAGEYQPEPVEASCIPCQPAHDSINGSERCSYNLCTALLPPSSQFVCKRVYTVRRHPRRSLRLQLHNSNSHPERRPLVPFDGDGRDAPLQVGRRLDPLQRWSRRGRPIGDVDTDRH